jgi:hypothetical protein
MQGYVRSGKFTVWGRVWDGIYENLLFYAMIGGGGGILLLYAIFGLGIPT